jgi:dCTP deaminase
VREHAESRRIPRRNGNKERRSALDLFAEAGDRSVRKSGVLPSQEIRELIANGRISAQTDILEEQIQPASIDLRLGKVAYRVVASFLPRRDSTISTKIRALQLEEIDLTNSAVLNKDQVYIAPLLERLSLPRDMSGKANPKSTTGRLDIFTRLMTEGEGEFEHVRPGYRGDLYVEIVPRTFSIVVKTGTKLNQLRFWRGKPERNDVNLRSLDRKRALIYYEDPGNVGWSPVDNGMRVIPGEASIENGLRFSVDLRGTEGQGPVAYRAKQLTPAIDLSKVGAYDPSDYWEAIVDPPMQRLVLRPGEFYLLASRERVGVPPGFAAEMEQYDPSLGEFSVHYAGFFDPGFGFGSDGQIKGTRAVLEVRAHEVPILLEDKQTVGRLNYYKMANIPEKVYGQGIGSSYQQQGLALSKQFKTKAVAAVLT